MRCWLERSTTFGGSCVRGLGITFHYGTTGMTYGDARPNMFFDATFWLWHSLVLRVVWKGKHYDR